MHINALRKMNKKYNIFGGIKVWGRFNFNLPRKFSFKFLRDVDWILIIRIVFAVGVSAMGMLALLVA